MGRPPEAPPPEPSKRYTRAGTQKLIAGDAAIAAREAANSLRQFDAVRAEIDTALERIADGGRYRLRPSLILALHRLAVEGIEASAGQWRNVPVDIAGSRHQPPHESRVPELMEELCDHVNDHLATAPPVELAAWTLWRICWIHPFADGNGRTARAVAYLVLCVAHGAHLPGRETIPALIVENKAPYYDALEAVDVTLDDGGEADISAMADYMEALLVRQLTPEN